METVFKIMEIVTLVIINISILAMVFVTLRENLKDS